MNKKYLPTTTEGKLAHVAEECGELIAAIGKSLRFGLDSYHPTKLTESNRDWVLREINDVRLALLALDKDL